MGVAQRCLLVALWLTASRRRGAATTANDTRAGCVTAAGTAVTEALTASNGRGQKLRRVSQNDASDHRGEDADITTGYVQQMVAEGIAAAMKVMGNATDQRFKSVETSLFKMQGQITTMAEMLDAVAETATPAPEEIEKLKQHLEEAQEREQLRNAEWQRLQSEGQKYVAEMKAIRDEVKAAAAEPAATPPHSKWGPAGSSTRFRESNASNSPKKVRFEDRRDAIMANLGEGLSPKEHLEKVKTTLAIAAVPDTWYTEISFNRRGSAACIVFNAPGLLRQARQYLQNAQVKGANGKSVWIDARRTSLPKRKFSKCTPLQPGKCAEFQLGRPLMVTNGD